MKAKEEKEQNLSRWVNEGGATVDTELKTSKKSRFRNEDPNKMPTPVVVFLRIIVPIAIAAAAMILVLASDGTQKYFYALISLIAIAWFAFQFAWLHKKRGLTPEIKP